MNINKNNHSFSGIVQGRICVHVNCVSPGCFSGQVLILGDRDLDLRAVNEGSIIMVPKLSADFFSAAARSLGVISRRGGACSHLAILLREMAIPGVVLRDANIIPPGRSFFARYSSHHHVMNEMICEF